METLGRIMRGANAVSGRNVMASAIINGVYHELFMIKTFEATIEKSDTVINAIGIIWSQHKGGVLNGALSITAYYGSPIFKEIMEEYANTGIDTYFDLTVTNNDPGSEQGAQTVTFHDCNLNNIQPAKVDVDSDALEEDMSLSFCKWTFTGKFTDLSLI